MQPAVSIDGGRGGIRHLEVTKHHMIAARAELTHRTDRRRLTRIGIDDLGFLSEGEAQSYWPCHRRCH
jgi:hypothetical protein